MSSGAVYQKHPGRATWSLEHFFEKKLQKGRDIFFMMNITMSPTFGRQ